MREASDPSLSEGVPAEPQLENTYNETTFHYFLAVQRRRSERSGRPFLLLMVEFKDGPRQNLSIDAALASKIFPALRRCLRETDFVGWYRTDLVAAAVLTELGDGLGSEAASPVGQRVKAALAGSVPPAIFSHLHVSVYQLQPTLTGSSR